MDRLLDPTHAPLDRRGVMLVGLQADLEGERQVETQEAEVLARQLGTRYIECSSKPGGNVEEVVSLVTRAAADWQMHLARISARDPTSTPRAAPTSSFRSFVSFLRFLPSF
jgi:hypothetical protein